MAGRPTASALPSVSGERSSAVLDTEPLVTIRYGGHGRACTATRGGWELGELRNLVAGEQGSSCLETRVEDATKRTIEREVIGALRRTAKRNGAPSEPVTII